MTNEDLLTEMKDEIKDYLNRHLDQNVVTFCDADVAAITAIIRRYFDNFAYVKCFPSLDKIFLAERKTHTLPATLFKKSEGDDD